MASKDEKVKTPLHNATVLGHKEIGELLITKGADVNVKGNRTGSTPLHRAALGDRKEIAELLIAKGADVNANNDVGGTPLHGAENKEIAELLIAAGADVNAKNDFGSTPLDWAVGGNHKETADLLRKHGGKTGEELN